MSKSIIKSTGDKVFDAFNVSLFVFLGFLMIFPLWNVLTTSLVDIGEFNRRPIILWPDNLTFISYRYIFASDRFANSVVISVFVTFISTVYSLILTSMVAYTGSKKYLPGRNAMLVYITLTMFFQGGLVPSYLWIRSLGLTDSLWVLILPTGVSVWNFVVMKSFFNQIEESLEESAKLDGANDLLIFFRIIVPLSKPLFATFALFFAVGTWNSWFPALLYIQDRSLQPMALVLRQIVIGGNIPPEIAAARAMQKFGNQEVFIEGIATAAVVVATLPILFIYPWLQKYFAKGIMIGSVKG